MKEYYVSKYLFQSTQTGATLVVSWAMRNKIKLENNMRRELYE